MRLQRAIAFHGSSEINGHQVTATVTGLHRPSKNGKTGPMAQVWILLASLNPVAARHSGRDEAVCGHCVHRHKGAADYVKPIASSRKFLIAPQPAAAPCTGNTGACYVRVSKAPLGIYRANQRRHNRVTSLAAILAALQGRALRMGAYGDPLAVPLAFWLQLLSVVRTWTGYTHSWALLTPEHAREWQRLIMASVDSRAERDRAWEQGWRTFRVMRKGDTVDAGEILCPASKEAGKRTTCYRCGLCRGTSNPAKSIAIFQH